jgi:uroporphyrinogen decarboxylase
MAEIPFQENQVDIDHVNRVLGTDYPPATRQYEASPDDQVEFNLRIGNDMVYLASIWELGRGVSMDARGRKHYVDGLMKTADALQHVVEPDLGEYERLIDRVLERTTGTGLGVIASVNHAPKLVTVAMGYEDYMVGLYENPGFITEFQAQVGQYCRRELEMVLSKPVDVVQTAVNVCMQTGPMYSLPILEAYEFPFIRHTVDRSKAMNKVTILHVDGRIADLIPTFIDMGVDILNPVEPSEHQDIVDLKRRYGDRVAFQGNLDVTSVLSAMPPAEVRRQAEGLIAEMAPGGGFILASSHDISRNVPWENFLAMREAAFDWAG